MSVILLVWFGLMSVTQIVSCREIRYADEGCDAPLGMEDGSIPDSAITSNTQWSTNTPPTIARLNHVAGYGKNGQWMKGGFATLNNEQGQWIQVDLGDITKVAKIGTQGRGDNSEWVTQYKVSFSFDDGYFEFYKQQPYNVERVFNGNSDKNSVVINTFNPPIIARYVRIQPVNYHTWMSLRMELYGCRSGFVTPQAPVCQEALGLESNAIPDSAITASSTSSPGTTYYMPGNGRLNFKKTSSPLRYGAWITQNTRDNSWFQVDFGRFVKVTIISTQGREDAQRWVKKYRVTYSYDGTFFRDYNEDGYVKEFDGNTDRYSIVSHKLKNPITTRYIRINPSSKAFYVWISLRADFYGCKSGFAIPEVVTSCKRPLGMESGLIPNSAITASTKWSGAYGPENGRLNFQGSSGRYGGWFAGTQDLNQWIQVNLGTETQVTGIATQGYYNALRYIKSYTLEYSHDGIYFQPYQQDLYTKTFTGNCDQNGIVAYDLIPPITAKYIRLVPESWYSYIAMRMELYGCRTGNGGYSQWSQWTQCSVTCGTGQRSRGRSCTNPPPSSGGKDCSGLGPDTETKGCNSGDCPVKVNGGYSNWGSYGPCSKTCGGGVQTRKRTCTNPPPSNGGEDCSALGSETSTRECSIDDCPVNGGYSNWGQYGPCSKTCGGGVKTRKRTCTNPPPSNGGEDCSGLGNNIFTSECNTDSCERTWTPEGCYQNKGRALGVILVKPKRFSKMAKKYQQCVAAANHQGDTVFGFDDTKCWTGPNATSSYDMYGLAKGRCGTARGGVGYGFMASGTMFVYQKNGGNWQEVDCYSNVSPKDEFALPELFDNKVGSVKGPDAIFDYCKGKAEAFGYKIFGADDKGCWSGDDAENTYKKYGASKLCDFSRRTGHGSGQDQNGDVFVYKLA